MSGQAFRVEIEGYDDFVRAVRRAQDTELPKALGELHRDIGSFIISRLNPKSVGAGAGAMVRPSATKREVLLRVGGGHRDSKADQWGKRQSWPGGRAPERPDIIGTAERYESQILRMLRDRVEGAFKPPFE